MSSTFERIDTKTFHKLGPQEKIDYLFRNAEYSADNGEFAHMDQSIFLLRGLYRKYTTDTSDINEAEKRIASIGAKGCKNALLTALKKCEEELAKEDDKLIAKTLEQIENYARAYAGYHNSLRRLKRFDPSLL